MDLELLVQNIKRLCAQKGVKPTIACAESGAGKNIINQIETRGSVPSVEKIQLLAQYLGVSTSELLGEEATGPLRFNVPEEKMEAVDALYQQLIEMPIEQIRAIHQLAQSIQRKDDLSQRHLQETPSTDPR